MSLIVSCVQLSSAGSSRWDQDQCRISKQVEQQNSLSVKQVAAVAVVVMVTQRHTGVLSSQDIQ